MLPLAYSLSLQVRILIPFSAPETGKPEYRKQKLGPLAFLHRKRKWWRYCTWHCTWKYQIWRQNRNRIWNRGRFSPIGPETEMVAPLDQLYHVTGNRIEGALLPNTRSLGGSILQLVL